MLNGIIIPCYNEENRLNLQAFQQFLNNTHSYKICFVNDGSADQTAQILNNFKAKNPNKVLVLDLKENVGKAEAVRQGVYYIASNSSIQTIGFLDADLATGFKDYANLTKTLVKNPALKMVIGSRKMNQQNIQRTAFRAFVGECFGTITSLITQLQISDTQCGAKVFRKSVALQIFDKSFISRWLFDVELLVRTRQLFGKNQAKNTIAEIALEKWDEVDGSKITLKDAVEFPKQLAQIAYNYNIAPTVSHTVQFVKNVSLKMNSALNSIL